ncbi:MAPEG family protein [Lysobacter sp. HA18]
MHGSSMAEGYACLMQTRTPDHEVTTAGADWRAQRRAGIRAIAAAMLVAALMWSAVRWGAPVIAGMDSVQARLVFAFKAWCLAVLFCLVTGIEAVAHERLQSAAFDPLAGVQTRRLQVNQRYLQNTLEQLVVFTAGLFGLAYYSDGGDAMRTVLATVVVWIAARLAFWIGYHRSAALRGLGAPGMFLALLMLLYVAARIGRDVAGVPGAVAVVAAFLAFEAVLFRTTRGHTAT